MQHGSVQLPEIAEFVKEEGHADVSAVTLANNLEEALKTSAQQQELLVSDSKRNCESLRTLLASDVTDVRLQPCHLYVWEARCHTVRVADVGSDKIAR